MLCAVVFATYMMSGLGITAGAHRLWAHRAYRARMPLRILLAVFNSMAFQVGRFLHCGFSVCSSQLQYQTCSWGVVGSTCGCCMSTLGKLFTHKKCLCHEAALASCLIYARALLEYVNLIVWVRSVNKMLPSVKFAECKVLTFLILCEKC